MLQELPAVRYTMIKETTNKGDIIVMNTYAPTIGATKYIKQL